MVFKTNFLKKFTLLAVAAFFSTALFSAPTKEAGKELFLNNCASCHNKNMVDKMTGPALSGVEARWGDQKALYSWIRNSQALIATGQPRAVAIWNEYKSVMTAFPGLTDEQMGSLLLYINNPGVKPPKTDGPGAVEKKAEGTPVWFYFGFALILGCLAWALNRIITTLRNTARAQEGLPAHRRGFGEWLTSHATIAFLVFGLILLGGSKMVDNATKMGRQQNYAPTQPIKFSHKQHAGIQKIDCQYCHDSARRSKHSGIPGTNTCMNCHAAVVKGSEYGTAEISKIFASSGYNPVTKKYEENWESKSNEEVEAIVKKWIGQLYMEDKKLTSMDEAGKLLVESQWEGIATSLIDEKSGDTKIAGPIEWPRIHNLADHAYFNHAQHVAVGKVECAQCHGAVEKMEVMQQHSNLSMGWCINCHRESAVQFKDNDYYKQYMSLHEEIKSGKRDKVTVEDIGGLECAKCHY